MFGLELWFVCFGCFFVFFLSLPNLPLLWEKASLMETSAALAKTALRPNLTISDACLLVNWTDAGHL